MLWWIVGTFLSAFSTIFRKKSIGLNNQLSSFWFQFLWWIVSIVFVVYFFVTKQALINIFFEKSTYLVAIICILRVISSAISQSVYKVEKISLIAPYENLNKIISIIISFFIFSDVSITSVLISIGIIVIIFASSIDLKSMKFPKVLKVFSFNQVLVSINTILIGYLLLKITSIQYYILENTIGIWILFLILCYRREIFKIHTLPKKFYITRWLSWFFGSISSILGLYIVSKFWITMNILLSFLYIGFILIFSYFFLQDTPTRKSIVLSVVITLLVGVWFYFK